MRIVCVHPYYHSGGAEVAGKRPPAWDACLSGALKSAGFDDIDCQDSMTHHLGDDDLSERDAELAPDPVGPNAILQFLPVLEHLYSRLLRADHEVRETSCRATGATACRFEVHRPHTPRLLHRS
jgi:anaerobic magnesium-protoporphyrin IX monomethyl ester cyclase